MTETFHERMKSPIPFRELQRRSDLLTATMKELNLDVILAQNLTQYMGDVNRWMTDTQAENQYPQSSFISADGHIGYIAAGGPPQETYPSYDYLRIGQPWATAPYFAVFNYTWDWEGKLFGEWIEQNKPKRIGISSFGMIQWNYLDYLQKAFPEIEWVDVSDALDPLRAVKSEDELAFIRTSAKIADKIMGFMPAVAQAGNTEDRVAAKAMQIATDHGAEKSLLTVCSAGAGEPLELYPGFFRNRTLQKGDQIYIQVQMSGPGGMFTSLGRMFTVGEAPSDAVQARQKKLQRVAASFAQALVPGAKPAELAALYAKLAKEQGFAVGLPLIGHGQGYNYIERPGLQAEETMPLAANMVLAVTYRLTSAAGSVYGSDSYVVTPAGGERLSRLDDTCLRT